MLQRIGARKATLQPGWTYLQQSTYPALDTAIQAKLFHADAPIAQRLRIPATRGLNRALAPPRRRAYAYASITRLVHAVRSAGAVSEAVALINAARLEHNRSRLTGHACIVFAGELQDLRTGTFDLIQWRDTVCAYLKNNQ